MSVEKVKLFCHTYTSAGAIAYQIAKNLDIDKNMLVDTCLANELGNLHNIIKTVLDGSVIVFICDKAMNQELQLVATVLHYRSDTHDLCLSTYSPVIPGTSGSIADPCEI